MAKAREMVEEMRRKGDYDGADEWLRIIVAIGELGELPTEARRTRRSFWPLMPWRCATDKHVDPDDLAERQSGLPTSRRSCGGTAKL
jgi:hypothetical protein